MVITKSVPAPFTMRLLCYLWSTLLVMRQWLPQPHARRGGRDLSRTMSSVTRWWGSRGGS